MKSSARMRSIAEVSPVATDFCPLAFAVEDVALRFLVIFLNAAMAKAEYSNNRQNAF